MATPLVIVMGGPNGSGKSTAASNLLPEDMSYLNADEIAKGLPGYPSQSADIEASRILLTQMAELEANRADFAMETTLASRSLAPRLVRLRKIGYEFRLFFAFLPDSDMAISRVASRVRQGGHNIPEDTIRRRYWAGIRNFFDLYQPIADQWSVYNTTQGLPVKVVATGRFAETDLIIDPSIWNLMQERTEHD